MCAVGPIEVTDSNVKRLINVGRANDTKFCTNFVKTSKYEWWNFAPKFLLEEFDPTSKIANCYFLLISALQCVPAVSNTNGYPTTLIPLTVVVIVDGIFQILDDTKRHEADKEANGSIARRYNSETKEFVDVKWYELAVGDFVMVRSRESIPADMVILGVSEKTDIPQGLCYVETKSLDGETNLKLRKALPNTLKEVPATNLLPKLEGSIEMEQPNKLIDSFTGVISLETYGREAIQPKNLLLRGCVLRNTDYAVGIVVNTGHDTKIMMSSVGTPSKSSYLANAASLEIKRIIVFLALLCFVGATGQTIWNNDAGVSSIWYLKYNPTGFGNWIIAFFYFFLLHATFIPVSLYVSMALARFFQSFFMGNDLMMYYPPIDSPCVVRTMTLNEELGQISHVFTDKTGTLTCNIMDFRKASINGISYGLGITEIGKAAWKLQGKEIPEYVMDGERMAKKLSVPHVSFYCPRYDEHMLKNGVERKKIQRFFRSVALCHDVIAENLNDCIKLSASNPDDDALVCAAGYFGYQFKDRQDKMAVIYNEETKQEELVEVLNTIAFTSKRKRMSVIVRETDGRFSLIMKGADTTMLGRLHPGQDELITETNGHMETYAIEGLRCLLVTENTILPDVYATWEEKYHAATTNIDEIEKLQKGVKNLIEDLQDEIESNATLIGCTAIEDRLQDGVPECVEELANAGVIIWVLTGDKEETAINIAVACNLVLPTKYMDHVIVNNKIASNHTDMLSVFSKATEARKISALPAALIIDGPSLVLALGDESEGGLKEALLHFSLLCKAVVCCRVSPDQKREMVHLIKHNVPTSRTLSIGDGANDVAMIQAAHVGVGIKGEEGLQAVNASDYAIAQFKYLSPLTLKHGRYNYIRMSGLIIYIFYKNIFMSMGQFWFNFYNGFSGQKFYTEGAIQLFNLMFTMAPILLFAVYDMDNKYETVQKHPKLYMRCVNHAFFNPKVFWTWQLHGVVESIIVSILPLYLLWNYDEKNGIQDTHWMAGALCFTAVVIITNFKMFLLQSKYYHLTFVMLFLSNAAWFLVATLISSWIAIDFDWYYIWIVMMDSSTFWLALLWLVVLVQLKDIFIYSAAKECYPTPSQVLQELEMLEVETDKAKYAQVASTDRDAA